jgi:hypothetical protein
MVTPTWLAADPIFKITGAVRETVRLVGILTLICITPDTSPGAAPA